MNWTAATAAFLCSAAAGFFAAAKRSRRLRTLEYLVLLLQRMLLELGFSRLPLPDMLFALQREPPFAAFGFLCVCKTEMARGQSLCAAWTAAAAAVQPVLQPWEHTHLLLLGGVLGTTDLQGQKTALEETLAVLERSLQTAQQKTGPAVSLCRVCGLCAGCVLFIMIL